MTRSPFPSRRQAWRPVWLASAGVITACLLAGSLSSRSSFGQAKPVFTNPTAITNPFLPLGSLNLDVLEGAEEGKAIRIERSRKPGTKTFSVNGCRVEALIMEDREFFDGQLKEITLDYFAQSDDGTVYYLGEDVDIYENGQVVSHEGAWLYGVHTKKLGLIMPARPRVGLRFRPEDVPKITREDDTVLSVSETITVPAGMYTGCLKVREKLSDGAIEFKYFAPGVGVIKEVPEDGEVNLISHR